MFKEGFVYGVFMNLKVDFILLVVVKKGPMKERNLWWV